MHHNIPIKDSGSLFVCYEAITSLIAEVISAVEAGNQEVVSTLGRESTAYVDALRRSKPHPQLPHANVECGRTLFARILEGDARVRAMVHPHLDRLQKRIDTARRVTNASNTYGSIARYWDDAFCSCSGSVRQCSDLRASAWLYIWYTIVSCWAAGKLPRSMTLPSISG